MKVSIGLILAGIGVCIVTDVSVSARSFITTFIAGAGGGKALVQVVFGDYNLGEGGGKALTQVVIGDYYLESFAKIPMNDMNMRVNPSQRYPGRTYCFYTEEPVYHFGHGLSYTDYTYKLLSAPNRLRLLRFMKLGSTIADEKDNEARKESKKPCATNEGK
ncbi:hypothetical protein Cgig2_009465 [Carnegiea gigantea]|uniref:Glycoside hydrolase family 3 C-terminal domain-containing protein n=1 Tax=Carnegiea gigantea TaxID=171969 RepID=A0A9Q1K6I0_9CARY|nr:hypothetical protein Cgig2_009465 [Carnegiea gigantea]